MYSEQDWIRLTKNLDGNWTYNAQDLLCDTSPDECKGAANWIRLTKSPDGRTWTYDVNRTFNC